MAGRHRGAAGFTLIELLVVVAVVGVLIAIAIPVVANARRAAVTTACLSNARQIGVALNAYLVDADGVLPTLRNRADLADPGPALDTEFAELGGALRCPADDAELFEATGTSYLWNFTVNGQPIDGLFSIVGGDVASRVPLVSDKEGFHAELPDKIVVLYADGHAERALVFSFTETGP